jgi:hypothetical protein
MFTNINNYDMIGMPKKYRKAIKGGLTFVHKLLMNKCKIEMNILMIQIKSIQNGT